MECWELGPVQKQPGLSNFSVMSISNKWIFFLEFPFMEGNVKEGKFTNIYDH